MTIDTSPAISEIDLPLDATTFNIERAFENALQNGLLAYVGVNFRERLYGREEFISPRRIVGVLNVDDNRSRLADMLNRRQITCGNLLHLIGQQPHGEQGFLPRQYNVACLINGTIVYFNYNTTGRRGWHVSAVGADEPAFVHDVRYILRSRVVS